MKRRVQAAVRYGPAVLHLCVTTCMLLPNVAWADVADSYALQVDGDHVRFTIAAPLAGQLTVIPLPHDLYAVTRKDGAPILRVQVGAGEAQDPDDFGDYSDR